MTPFKLLLLLLLVAKISAQCSEEEQIKAIEAETKVTFKILLYHIFSCTNLQLVPYVRLNFLSNSDLINFSSIFIELIKFVLN
jgi:hypothetical protein